jgi:hypothetical protein
VTPSTTQSSIAQTTAQSSIAQTTAQGSLTQTTAQSSAVRRHEDGAQQGNVETNLGGKSAEKHVPPSWMLDVVIKKEPEESA